MSARYDFDDIWTGVQTTQSVATEPKLIIVTFEDVEPLDEQLGVHQTKTVPDVLYEPLFSQPYPTVTKPAVANHDLADVLPLYTYAIIDAAKVANLAEMLETSGLEYRCLFKGKAYEDLKDVAPWIIRLEEDNSFTRNLFTSSDTPWHLWGNESGIFIRSHETLKQLWSHFRKFTRVQDEGGQWFYFRFWEPLLHHSLAMDDFQRNIINASFFGNNLILAVDPLLKCAVLIGVEQQFASEAKKSNARLLGVDLQLLKHFKDSVDNRAIAADIHTSKGRWAADNGMSILDCVNKVEASVQLARSIGLRKTPFIMRFVRICEAIGDDFLRSQKVRKTVNSGHPPARLIAELEFDAAEDEVRQP